MKFPKKCLAIGAIAALMLTLAACGNQKQKTVSSKKQVLNWVTIVPLLTQDNSLATDDTSFQSLLSTGDGLYRFDKNAKPKLSLATKAKVSKDGKTYDFTLRKNAKWSNGDPITANDFVYSYRRTVDPTTKSQMAFYFYQIKNAQAINQGKMKPSTLGATAVSKYHLRLQLTRPLAYLKNLLAWPLFFPQNQKVVKKYGKLYGTQAKYLVSSGPFVLTKWDGNTKSWTYLKNKNYWDAKHVKLTKINEQLSESTITSYNLYQTGKLDMTPLAGPQVDASKNKKAYSAPLISGTIRLDLNQNKVKAFKNLKIRQAFSYALNRKEFADQIMKNGSVPAKGLVPVGMGNNPKTGESFDKEAYTKAGVSYDFKKAKKLIKEGYKESGIKSLNVSLLVVNTGKHSAEYLQSQLDRLPGVNVSISYAPTAQLVARQNSGNYDLTLKSWLGVFSDPINFLNLYQKGSAFLNNGWHNAKYDQLINKAENADANNPEKRWNDLVAAEKLLMQDQGTVPLLQQASPRLIRPTVKNLYFNPTGVPYDFKYAYLQ